MLTGVLALAGCQPPVVSTPPAPTPAPVPAPVPPAPAPVFTIPTPSTAPARLEVLTRIVATDGSRSDSSNTVVDLLLQHDSTGLLGRVARNDTVGRLDSLPPIPVDRSGRWTRSVLALPCRDLGLLPSPLVVRLTQPRQAASWPVRDSLTYHMCVRGAPRTVAVALTWLEPRPSPDHGSYEQMVQLTGSIRGDSTRTFPMRTTGSLRGDATLEVAAPEGVLRRSSGTFTVDLRAQANALDQRVTQSVAFVARPRD